jgi:hypothetical protein
VGLVADQITGGDRPVTSVDPYDQFFGMVDPAIEPWSNVTFADLYYQNLPAGPVGRGMNVDFARTVDWKVDLSGARIQTTTFSPIFLWERKSGLKIVLEMMYGKMSVHYLLRCPHLHY